MFGDILQPTHLLFILVVALLVLGPKRLPEVGKTLGAGLRDFRQAISGEVGEHDWTHTTEAEVEPPPEQRQPPPTEPADATVIDGTPAVPVTEPVATVTEPTVAAPAASAPGVAQAVAAPRPPLASRPGAPTPRAPQPGAPVRRAAQPQGPGGQRAPQPAAPTSVASRSPLPARRPAAPVATGAPRPPRSAPPLPPRGVAASHRPAGAPPARSVPRPAPGPVQPPADNDQDA